MRRSQDRQKPLSLAFDADGRLVAANARAERWILGKCQLSRSSVIGRTPSEVWGVAGLELQHCMTQCLGAGGIGEVVHLGLSFTLYPTETNNAGHHLGVAAVSLDPVQPQQVSHVVQPYAVEQQVLPMGSGSERDRAQEAVCLSHQSPDPSKAPRMHHRVWRYTTAQDICFDNGDALVEPAQCSLSTWPHGSRANADASISKAPHILGAILPTLPRAVLLPDHMCAAPCLRPVGNIYSLCYVCSVPSAIP